METLESTETTTGKAVKITAKNSDLVKRKDGYTINPTDIVVKWEDNVREDYGQNEEEDFQSFKASIKEDGLLQNIKLYLDQATGKWTLYHGYRRMKAILELIAEGTVFTSISFDEVKAFNEEKALVDHFVMNTGRPLNDVEMANGLRKLRILMGGDEVTAKELADRVKLKYQKVITLLNFAENAGSQIKNAVIKGEASFDAARQIVKNSGSVTEQNELLSQAKENARKSGSSKVKSKNIPIESNILSNDVPLEAALSAILTEANKIEGKDNIFYNRVVNLFKMAKEGSPMDEIMLLFHP